MTLPSALRRWLAPAFDTLVVVPALSRSGYCEYRSGKRVDIMWRSAGSWSCSSSCEPPTVKVHGRRSH
jgi:hypothetical protein